MNDNQFYLVDVIAHVLHHLKDRLLAVLKDLNLKATDFNWVITVPAFWKSGGKEMSGKLDTWLVQTLIANW